MKSDQVIAASLGIFVGFAFAILVIAVSGAAFLWFYGNFWTTMLIIFLGGNFFTFGTCTIFSFMLTSCEG